MKNKDLAPVIDFTKYCKSEYIIQLGDYEIEVRDGKTYAVKKKPVYPKTYEECCDILNTCQNVPTVPGWKGSKIAKLQQILICRDTYWKIAGEEMGLGKPWKPDWSNWSDKFYCICTSEDEIIKGVSCIDNKILAFPTEEIQDIFYENFKDLIEQCKELL